MNDNLLIGLWSEHGFFELIPIILKTEHVILQGNDMLDSIHFDPPFTTN